MEKTFPVANEGLPEAASTPDGKNFCKDILNSVFNEPHTTKAQPFVSKISNGKHKFLQNGNLKRKRDIYTLDLSGNNLEDFKHSPVESPASPSFPKCARMVTALKYQNGDFVEVQSSSSMYNSPMSLRDMRNAIIASLESYINQPGTDLASHCGGLWSANSRAQQTSPKVKDCGENAETSKKATELSKQRKPSSSHVEVKRVYNPPDDESIKFANRQKELMRMKKELKKKIKMETSEGKLESN